MYYPFFIIIKLGEADMIDRVTIHRRGSPPINKKVVSRVRIILNPDMTTDRVIETDVKEK